MKPFSETIERHKRMIFVLTVPGLEGTMLDLMSCIPYSDGLKMHIMSSFRLELASNDSM